MGKMLFKVLRWGEKHRFKQIFESQIKDYSTIKQ